jgi:hypothetical protein
MKAKDKNSPFFIGADDKWLFTKRYIEDLSDEYSFERAFVLPLANTDKPFEALAKVHFNGNGVTNLPEWVWEVIDEYEQFFSHNLKMDLFTEGCVIFVKA